ncbi:hypothetical protein [Zobellella sp. DQSA1]|uniref:hypothetical protein n=1 Tax=Zobellella sp. DQSA1 TaxID=3342386 RepID=UPI0035C267F8
MTTPDHIARIIERIEPADREALEQHLVELDNRTVTLQGVIKILEQDNKQLQGANKTLVAHNERMHDAKKRWRGLAVNDGAFLVEVMEILNRTPAASQHHDDMAVDAFAGAMKDKLAASRSKGRSGWDDPEQCSVEYLANLLVEHVAKGDPVDVANLAMMLHQRGADSEVLASSLAEVQAKSVQKFAQEIGVFDPEYDDQGYIEVPRYAIKEYINRIRQEAQCKS